jgi:hypothetical protein
VGIARGLGRKRKVIVPLIAAAIQCLGPAPIPSQAGPAWDALFKRSLEHYTANHLKREKSAVTIETDTKTRARTSRSHRIPSLLGANSVNAIDLASAAIDTNVDGADAGVTVAPLLLAGIATPSQLKVTLASLKDGKTRAGLGYSYASTPEFNTYESLKLGVCKEKTDDFSKILAARQCPFERSCAVVAVLPAPLKEEHDPRLFWLQSRAICGLAGEEELHELAATLPPFNESVDEAGATIKKAISLVGEAVAVRDPDGGAMIRGLRERASADLESVSAFVQDDIDSCNAKKIGDAYIARTWEAEKLSIGTQYAADLFTAIFGSSDPAASHGQPARHDARTEFDYSKGRYNLTLGLGYASERTSVGKPFQGLFKPSCELSVAVAAIGSESLLISEKDKDGVVVEKVNVKDGAVVPHVTVGLSLAEENKDKFSAITSVEITPYVAFTFTDKLLVRAGIPIQAKRACTTVALAADSKCDPLTVSTTSTELQWTIPVSIVTVLRL